MSHIVYIFSFLIGEILVTGDTIGIRPPRKTTSFDFYFYIAAIRNPKQKLNPKIFFSKFFDDFLWAVRGQQGYRKVEI